MGTPEYVQRGARLSQQMTMNAYTSMHNFSLLMLLKEDFHSLRDGFTVCSFLSCVWGNLSCHEVKMV
jgi:hypothetical protein